MVNAAPPLSCMLRPEQILLIDSRKLAQIQRSETSKTNPHFQAEHAEAFSVALSCASSSATVGSILSRVINLYGSSGDGGTCSEVVLVYLVWTAAPTRLPTLSPYREHHRDRPQQRSDHCFAPLAADGPSSFTTSKSSSSSPCSTSSKSSPVGSVLREPLPLLVMFL